MGTLQSIREFEEELKPFIVEPNRGSTAEEKNAPCNATLRKDESKKVIEIEFKNSQTRAQRDSILSKAAVLGYGIVCVGITKAILSRAHNQHENEHFELAGTPLYRIDTRPAKTLADEARIFRTGN